MTPIRKLTLFISGLIATLLSTSTRASPDQLKKMNFKSIDTTLVEIKDKYGKKISIPMTKAESSELIEWMKEMGFENIDESTNSHNSADSCSDNIHGAN